MKTKKNTNLIFDQYNFHLYSLLFFKEVLHSFLNWLCWVVRVLVDRVSQPFEFWQMPVRLAPNFGQLLASLAWGLCRPLSNRCFENSYKTYPLDFRALQFKEVVLYRSNVRRSNEHTRLTFVTFCFFRYFFTINLNYFHPIFWNFLHNIIFWLSAFVFNICV